MVLYCKVIKTASKIFCFVEKMHKGAEAKTKGIMAKCYKYINYNDWLYLAYQNRKRFITGCRRKLI